MTLKVHKMRSRSERYSAESNARNNDNNNEKQLQSGKKTMNKCEQAAELRAPEDSDQCS